MVKDTDDFTIQTLIGFCKMKDFQLYENKKDYTKFLVQGDPWPTDGLPIVIEIEGKYYIEGNGKHRLTILNVLG